MTDCKKLKTAENIMKLFKMASFRVNRKNWRGFRVFSHIENIQTKSTNHQHQMTSFIHFITRIAQLRHQHARRRFVERLARKFTSRSKAVRFARRIP